MQAIESDGDYGVFIATEVAEQKEPQEDDAEKKDSKEDVVPLLATDTVTDRSRSSVPSVAALPASARSEGGSGPVSARVKSARLDAKSADEKDESKIDEERKVGASRALTYQDKDVVFISIIIEGEVLEHDLYDSAQVIVDICGQSYVAGVCLAREKGSKRRSFNVNWGDIHIPADSFRTEQVLFSVIVTDKSVLDDFPSFPSEKSRGTVWITMY